MDYEYMNIDGFHMVVPEVKYVADVIVYKIGKYAVAKNRHGEVIAVSEDHAEVLEKAIVTLPPHGGVVYLLAGIYDLYSPIELVDKRYWVLRGEGFGGYQPQRFGQTVLRKKFNGAMLLIDYTTDRAENSFGLENIVFYGNYENGYTGKGIVVNPNANGRAYNFWLKNIKIFRTESTALEIINGSVHVLEDVFIAEIGWSGDIKGNGHGIRYYDCYDWQWYHVEVDTNWQTTGYAAVHMENSHGEIIGGHFEGWRCLDLRSNTRVVVIGAYMPWARERNVFTQDFLFLDSCRIRRANQKGEYSGAEASNIYSEGEFTHIVNCEIGEYGDENTEYAIYVTKPYAVIQTCKILRPVYIGSYEAAVIGNYFGEQADVKIGNIRRVKFAYNHVVAPFVTWSEGGDHIIIGNYFGSTVNIQSSDDSVKYNKGYVTENKGVTTIPAGSTSVTVNHGLVAKPRVVIVTPYGNTKVWVPEDSITDTSFDIVTDTAPSEDLKVAWYAEV